jgi:hypothetical protein
MIEERGYIHTWVDGDSIVNGTIYHRLRQEIQYKSYTYTFESQSQTYIPSDTILNSIQPLPSIFVYTANDSVYFLDKSNKKQFVWYNNPQPGDIWHLGKGPKYKDVSQDSVNAYVKIESVNLEPLNGFPSKTITFTFCDSLGNVGTPASIDSLAIYAYTKTNTVYGLSNLILYATYRNYYRTFGGDEMNLFDNRLICFQSPQTSHIQFLPEFQDCFGLITFSMNMSNSASTVSVYPNPAHQEINLFNPSQDLFYKGQIIDLSGKVVKNDIQLAPQTTTIVPLAHLSRGVYILKLVNDAGEMQTHKIIKN